MSQSNHYQLAVQAIIRQLRGSNTQAQFSHVLGANFNVVNRWEKGTRSLYWQDFVCICKHFNFDIGKALEKSIHLKSSSYPEQTEVLKLFDRSSVEVIETQYPKQKFYRLITGSSKLKFSDFLFFIDIVYGRVLRFIRCFLPIDEQNHLALLFKSESEYSKISSQNLSLFLISQCLELDGYYKQNNGGIQFISDRLEISRMEVEKSLKTLEESGILFRSGGLYKKVKKNVDFGSVNSMSSRNLCRLLRKEIQSFSETHSPLKEKHKAAFLSFSSNTELDQKVFELSRKFYVDLKNLVDSEPSPKQHVSLVLVDLFKLID